MHRAGVKHRAADELSAIPTTGVDNTELDDKISVMVVTRTKNRKQKNSGVSSQAQKINRLPSELDESDVALPTLYELIVTQFKTLFCEQSRQASGIPGRTSTLDKNAVLVKKLSIDGPTQKLVATSSRARLLQQAYHITLAGHSGKRRLYDLLQRD